MLDSVANPVPAENRVDPAALIAALDATQTTQTELAKRMNLTLVSVNRWVNGKTAFSTSRWVHVKQALGLPLDWKPGDPVPSK